MTQRLKDLSFFDHLDELRGRIIKSVLAVLIAAIFIYYYIDTILSFVIQPVGHLVFTYPTEAFIAQLSLTFIGATLLALPIIIYQIWKFVSLGLHEHERKYVAIFGPLSLICFLIGGLFAYFIMIPISMRFLLSFSSDVIVPMITVNKYISFVGMLILAFGIIFELPLIILFLSKIGIATPAFLIQKRKHAIVIILVLSALLTPPDIFTQLLMSVPLIALYEVGVIACKLTYKEKEF